MGDEPPGDVTHAEQRELDALRKRAYGPRADIFDDAPALSRLLELEDRVRLERRPVERGPVFVGGPAVVEPERSTPEPDAVPSAPVVRAAPPLGRAARWRPSLIVGAVVAAVLIGATAWSGTARDTAADMAARDAESVPLTIEPRAATYQRYLDGMRDEVLSLPGSETIADRMIHDELRPYGTLYGRIVGSGPTIDHEFCMIIADRPASSITCISVEEAYASPVTVTLPSGYSDSESDVPAGPGALVSYTLMPGGSVVAVRADASDPAGA